MKEEIVLKRENLFLEKVEVKFPNQCNILQPFKTVDTKLLVEHKCADGKYFQWMTTPSTLLHGKGSCPKCEGLDRGQEAYERKVYELVGDEYLVVGEYINSKTYATFEHNIEGCHHVFTIKSRFFLNEYTRCPKCSPISRAEEKIEKIFVENKINYDRQYRFDDCIFKLPLRFDFAVYRDVEKTDLLFLLEYQGQQHYSPQTFNGISMEKAENTFKETVIKDKIKSDYCKLHNVNLIEITFQQIKKIDEDMTRIVDEILENYKLI